MKNISFLFIAFFTSFSYAEKRFPESPTDHLYGPSAITWEPNGGRFGDNLLSFAKALWLWYTYNIPILYRPFPYSDQLILHETEDIYTDDCAALFSEIVHLPPSSHYELKKDSNTLYVSHWKTEIIIDWFDKIFVEELKKRILPRYNLEKITLPDGYLSIAVHVRNGGEFTPDNDQERERCPLRFVPDEFFIAQIQRIIQMFAQEKIYVHIFTDHPEPKKVAEKFDAVLNNPRITFGYREHDNSHNSNVLEDFFSMMEFDCLIRPGSHFSRFVQRLGNNQLVIYPESFRKTADGRSVIDVINIKKRTENGWKTSKIKIA